MKNQPFTNRNFTNCITIVNMQVGMPSYLFYMSQMGEMLRIRFRLERQLIFLLSLLPGSWHHFHMRTGYSSHELHINPKKKKYINCLPACRRQCYHRYPQASWAGLTGVDIAILHLSFIFLWENMVYIMNHDGKIILYSFVEEIWHVSECLFVFINF